MPVSTSIWRPFRTQIDARFELNSYPQAHLVRKIAYCCAFTMLCFVTDGTIGFYFMFRNKSTFEFGIMQSLITSDTQGVQGEQIQVIRSDEAGCEKNVGEFDAARREHPGCMNKVGLALPALAQIRVLFVQLLGPIRFSLLHL